MGLFSNMKFLKEAPLVFIKLFLKNFRIRIQQHEKMAITIQESRVADPKLLISDPDPDPAWKVISDPDPDPAPWSFQQCWGSESESKSESERIRTF